MVEEVEQVRIHIGNVSPKLYESQATLLTRIAKFGKVVSELSFHTKPLQDHYFAYITMELTPSQFEKLKAAFNGVQFMGMKLSVGKAKTNWEQTWLKDCKRQDSNKLEREMRNRVDEARKKRIKEAKTPYKINSVTDQLIIPPTINPNNSSYGYQISSHTYNEMSGNTKNKPPSHALVGSNSYGAWTKPVTTCTTSQQYSNISGGSELIKGRHRITPRPADHFIKRQQTMRILINGELKQLKSYKQKLWGYEKNKSLQDLTFRFVDGKWRSGDNHIVDSYTAAKKLTNKCGITGTDAIIYGKSVSSDNKPDDKTASDEESARLLEEKQKNKLVLASLLTKYDFDKPLEIEEDTLGIDKEDISYDSKGRRKVAHYDYELKGGIMSDEEEYDLEPVDNVEHIIETFVSSTERPKEEIYYDEDDEGNELDLDTIYQQYSTEASKQKYDEIREFELATKKTESTPNRDSTSNITERKTEVNTHEENTARSFEESVPIKDDKNLKVSEESDDEFIPTFGKSEVTINNTETLRSLFNPNGVAQETKTSGFKLALDENDDDFDEQKQIDIIKQNELLKQIQKQQEEEFIKQQATKFGLFWSHFDSHFLQTQTQLSKIGSSTDIVKLPGESETILETAENADESNYEKWFWSMRGEISRECKRRKRDVTRIFRKKSKKSTIV